MKLKISFLLALTLLMSSGQAVAREQVMIILGDPGLITTISYTNARKGAVGSRGYIGKTF